LRTLRQLLTEFWLPFSVAIGWTIYSASASADWGPEKLIANFAAAFFFAAWGLGQWFRVTKQLRVEANLEGIAATVQSTLDQLEKKTEDLAAYITGGKSVCHFTAQPEASGIISTLFLTHHGEHPLYDVTARITDVQVFTEAARTSNPAQLWEMFNRSHRFGDLVKGHGKTIDPAILGDFHTTTERSFNIFFTARNGSFTQELRYRAVDGGWRRASRVLQGNEVRFEYVAEGYPREADGSIKWN